MNPDAILKVIQEGLSLWKEFISTREEAYRRGMDKRMKKCIECGEKYIQAQEAIDSGSCTKEKGDKLKLKYRVLFFKYN